MLGGRCVWLTHYSKMRTPLTLLSSLTASRYTVTQRSRWSINNPIHTERAQRTGLNYSESQPALKTDAKSSYKIRWTAVLRGKRRN